MTKFYHFCKLTKDVNDAQNYARLSSPCEWTADSVKPRGCQKKVFLLTRSFYNPFGARYLGNLLAPASYRLHTMRGTQVMHNLSTIFVET
jgi:hypothetical protein